MGNINFKIYFDKLSLLTLMTLIVMYSCENKESSKKYTIGFSQCCDDPWRTAMNLEMRRELAFHSELNLQIRVANNDNVKQEEDIKNLVKSGIDLLIVSPNESKAFTRLLDSIFKTGLPIILVDRRTESNAFSAFVGGNNVEIGRMAASYLKTLHPYGVNALEFQLSHSITPAIERSQGFTAEFVNNPKHRIIRSLELDREIDSLKQEFQNILNTQPEINSIFAHSDFLAHQASSWLKGMAWSRSITIVGVDGLPGEGNGIDLVEKMTLMHHFYTRQEALNR
jgi:ABC-type sugar transport system substrate-binding protein